jgi:hypothetical protein
MKEIRPSTWITLAVLCLLIFVPAFLIDVDSLAPPDNTLQPDANNPIRPVDPFGDNKPAPQSDEPGPSEQPPEVPDNQPESPAVD